MHRMDEMRGVQTTHEHVLSAERETGAVVNMRWHAHACHYALLEVDQRERREIERERERERERDCELKTDKR
jgi:hypothetical protein